MALLYTEPVLYTSRYGTAWLTDVSQCRDALGKHIVGESEHLSKSVFECFSPWFAVELAA